MSEAERAAQDTKPRQPVLSDGRPWEDVFQFWFPDNPNEDIEAQGLAGACSAWAQQAEACRNA